MPQTPARTGVSLHDREHLAGHVDDDLVGVAVRHQAGERAAAAHPVAAGVVDDDQVGAAGLRQLRRQARAGAGADDRAAGVDLGAQPRERLGPRHDAASEISSCSRFAIASANAGSLTSASTSCTSTFAGSTRRADRVEQRPVGIGVVEDLALRRDRGDAAQRHEQHGRAGGGIQLLADDPPDLAALVRRRPHQRDRRVVDVEVPVAIALRDRLDGAEVDHVERAERDDLRDAAASRPTRAAPAPRRARRPRRDRRTRSSSRRATRR